MKQLIRRFVDWMVMGPFIFTLPFIPLLLVIVVIAAVAAIINRLKGSPLMKSLETFKQRFLLFAKRVKARNGKNTRHGKNPDWSRIDEPDTFLQPFVLLMFTLLIIVTAGMINYVFAMPGSLEFAIARFLVPFIKAGQSFHQVYAVFTFAVLTLIETIIFSFIAIMGEPDHNGIVGMLTDLDVNLQDRIAEMEQVTIKHLDDIEHEIGINVP